jgi:hypothetical protein
VNAVISGKQMGDYFVVVEEVRVGKSELAFRTMWKRKGRFREGESMPAETSKTLTPEATPSSSKPSNETIAQTAPKSQRRQHR